MKISSYHSIPSFTQGRVQFAGRNSNGKITVRHRGGGHKQSYRYLDWKRQSGNGFVVGFEYDPKRNTQIIKLYHPTVGTDSKSAFSYIIAPTGVTLFQELSVYSENKKDTSFDSVKLLQPGDFAPLSSFEPGDFLHSVEAYPGQGSIFARSAGTFCQVRTHTQESFTCSNDVSNKTGDWIKVRLPSGSHRLISLYSNATFGVVSLPNTAVKQIQKAGRSRWLGIRPSVRGVARNPVDHPHGGGQGKTSGGRPSVTFKAWPTKGQPTRSPKRRNALILTSRKHLINID